MQGKADKSKRQSRQENSLLRSRYPAQYGSRPKCLPLAVDTVPKIVRAVLLSCRAEVATGKPRRKRSGACHIADITQKFFICEKRGSAACTSLVSHWAIKSS